jgi:hypothetical protein
VLCDATVDHKVDVIHFGKEVKGMRNKYPRSARAGVEEHIVEDGLSHMSIQSRERILDEE